MSKDCVDLGSSGFHKLVSCKTDCTASVGHVIDLKSSIVLTSISFCFNDKLDIFVVLWGSKYQTCLVFDRSKPIWLRISLCFECHLNTKQLCLFLKGGTHKQPPNSPFPFTDKRHIQASKNVI